MVYISKICHDSLANEGVGRPSGRELSFPQADKEAYNRPCRGQILGWTGLIQVDGTTYTWMGAPAPASTLVSQMAYEYTSTRSTFIMDVDGLITMNITFLSPVNPTDLMRQSLTFSYVDVVVTSSDGASHDVKLYTDITAGVSASLFGCLTASLTIGF